VVSGITLQESTNAHRNAYLVRNATISYAKQ
jgi:hypothetical protein